MPCASPCEPLSPAPASCPVSLLQRGPCPGLQPFRDPLLPPGLSRAAAPAGKSPQLRPGALPGLRAGALPRRGLARAAGEPCSGPAAPPALLLLRPGAASAAAPPSAASSSAWAASGPCPNLLPPSPAPPAWLRGSAVPCGGALGPAGAGWGRTGAAPASPHRGPQTRCQYLHRDTPAA